MALPRKLKYLNLFNDGNNYQGVVESVTLPKVARKLESYRGGGMNGSVGIDLGLDDDALNFEWVLGGTEMLPYKQLGIAKADGVMLRFAGSLQRDDSGDVVSVEVVVRGRHKEIDTGEWKQGDSSTTKISTQASYYKLTIDAEVLIEIDIINMIEIIGGEDRLASHRRAIGL